MALHALLLNSRAARVALSALKRRQDRTYVPNKPPPFSSSKIPVYPHGICSNGVTARGQRIVARRVALELCTIKDVHNQAISGLSTFNGDRPTEVMDRRQIDVLDVVAACYTVYVRHALLQQPLYTYNRYFRFEHQSSLRVVSIEYLCSNKWIPRTDAFNFKRLTRLDCGNRRNVRANA